MSNRIKQLYRMLQVFTPRKGVRPPNARRPRALTRRLLSSCMECAAETLSGKVEIAVPRWKGLRPVPPRLWPRHPGPVMLGCEQMKLSGSLLVPAVGEAVVALDDKEFDLNSRQP